MCLLLKTNGGPIKEKRDAALGQKGKVYPLIVGLLVVVVMLELAFVLAQEMI